jgi:hypothetical protein
MNQFTDNKINIKGIVTISAAPGTGGISATVAGSAGAGAVVGAISAAAG